MGMFRSAVKSCLYRSILGGSALTAMFIATPSFADIDNTATAFAEYAGQSIASNDSTVSVPVPVAAPSLTLTKTISDVTDTNGNGVTDAGDVVVYAFAVQNTGNVSLADVTVIDPKASMSGEPLAILAPNATDTTTFTATYTLTQDDVDAGGFENSASVEAKSPALDVFTDVSDAGDETVETANLQGDVDNDPTNDPTVLVIEPLLGLEVLNTAALDMGENEQVDAGDLVTYTTSVTNTSSVTLFDIAMALTEDFAGLGEMGPFVVETGVTALGQDDTLVDLAPGETATYSVTYALHQADVDAGKLSYQVSATGTSAALDVGFDLSDSLLNTDLEGTYDPTTITFETFSDLGVLKTTLEPVAQFPTIYDLTYVIEIENNGNITETSVAALDSITEILYPTVLYTAEKEGGRDPIVTVTGAATGGAHPEYDGETVVNLLADGTTIAPNSTLEITLEVRVYTGPNENTDKTFNYPTQSNTVYVTSDRVTEPLTSVAPAGLEDIDDDGANDQKEPSSASRDTDGDGRQDILDYDPQGYFYCKADGRIVPGGRIEVYDNAGNLLNGAEGLTNNILLESDGSTGHYEWYSVGVAGTFEMRIYPPHGMEILTDTHVASVLDLTFAENVYTGQIGANAGENIPVGSNEYLDTGYLSSYMGGASLNHDRYYTRFSIEAGDPNIVDNNIPLTNCTETAEITASKSANVAKVELGDVVSYTLEFEVEDFGLAILGASIVDDLPVGQGYVPETAMINASAVEPVVSGGDLTWPGVDVLAGDIITVTYKTRVTAEAPVGPMINRTWVEAADGSVKSNVASATVSRSASGVFDCTDIIGRVFNDRNANGIFDAGETGIASAQIMTVTGDIITTDAYGRYSVPCAMLPKDNGSNFILKLDVDGLEAGTVPITPNPRVTRVTRGKSAKVNFGVLKGKLVEIKLNASAFGNDGKVIEAFSDALKDLAKSRRNKAATAIDVSYIRTNESKFTSKENLRTAQKQIREIWRKNANGRVYVTGQIVRKTE